MTTPTPPTPTPLTDAAEWIVRGPYDRDIKVVNSDHARSLERDNARLREALEWYSDESINHHNYHATMGTDLTAKARAALTPEAKR